MKTVFPEEDYFGRRKKNCKQIVYANMLYQFHFKSSYFRSPLHLDFSFRYESGGLHENHIIPDVLTWRGRARYRPHFTDMQEPPGIVRRDMNITNNTPG
jgi:hypothetical protein